MEILDAVNLVCGINGEGYSVKAGFADDASETAWVVRLAGGSQDPVQDGLEALAALLQCVRVVGLTQGLVVWSPVEWLVEQTCVTLGAGEALHVVEPPHGPATRALSDDSLAASHA